MLTVPSRRENKNLPSRAVEKKKYRPFPSWKKLYTVPFRPVVKNYVHRPVPSSKNMYTVSSRRDNFLFERSEFLIDTSQKKSLRVCTCARVQ